MSSKLKNAILTIITIILIIIFTPFFGGLYDKYFGPVSTGFFWGPENPEYFEGFFVSYAFFITFFTIILGKYKYFSIFIGLLILFYLFLTAWAELIINLLVVIISWLLAQIIKFIYKKIKK